MCNPKPSSSTSSFLPSNTNNNNNNKTHFTKTVDLPKVDDEQLHRLPTLSEAVDEMKAIGKISGPTAISSLLLYSRAAISMLFLGYLGELELAGGSLAIGFANITGYSILGWLPVAIVFGDGRPCLLLLCLRVLPFALNGGALSVGVSTRVGNELGANRPGKARISMIVSLFCAVAIGLAAMVFTTLMRHQWGKFFTNDTEILELTAVALPIAGLCELGNCPQTTGCGVLRVSPSILPISTTKQEDYSINKNPKENSKKQQQQQGDDLEGIVVSINDEFVKSASLETDPLLSKSHIDMSIN
ncbi:Multi antimicrobial extrusion protein [Corchorus capsularis]|uniref:Multi antimicrobial extrusion protein n=1 Tax=Corchorus capsularis TaxID=210143 RepID=A0A1R3FYG7_COCAP|nr:Multi antimicrobial extrusion protein [Corchorus capsularis]